MPGWHGGHHGGAARRVEAHGTGGTDGTGETGDGRTCGGGTGGGRTGGGRTGEGGRAAAGRAAAGRTITGTISHFQHSRTSRTSDDNHDGATAWWF